MKNQYYKYEIIEFQDQNGFHKSWLCAVKRDGKLVGDIFEASTYEQAFAWLRLMMGAYPGTSFNDDNEIGAVA